MRTARPATPRNIGAAWPALTLLGLTCAALVGPALAGPALAGQIRETDLMISSKVGKVATGAEGDNAQARSIVHSVDIKRGSQTGDVRVSGQAGHVTTQAGGQNVSVDSAIGGVSVGGNK